MTQATLEAPAQAVPEAAPTPTPVTQVSPEDFDSQMTDMLLTGEIGQPRPETPTPAPAPAVPTPETTPAPETPAPAPTPEPKGEEPLEPEEPAQPGKFANRVRIPKLQEADKGYLIAATTLAQTESIPLDEAWKRVTGQLTPKQQPKPETPPEPSEVEKLESRQVEIEARLLELGDDPLNGGEINQLNREVGRNDARIEALKVVTGLKTDLAKQDAAFEQAEAVNGALIFAQRNLHPDLGNEQSALFAEARRIATDPTHPDYNPNRGNGPRDILDVGKLAMLNMNMRPQPASNVPRETIPPPVVPPQPGSVVKPAAATKATAPLPPALSPAEKVQRSQQIVSAVLDGDDVPKISGGHRFLIM